MSRISVERAADQKAIDQDAFKEIGNGRFGMLDLEKLNYYHALHFCR